MKPSAFQYHRPASVSEAVQLLATLDNAKLLAGGQSLMPMMNFRAVMADHVIDLNGIAELSGISLRDGRLHIGAMTRQRDIEHSPLVAEHCPLLVEAYHQVGHRQTRNRGTLGGSLSHFDPASEQPACILAMDGMLVIQSPRGQRELPMSAFGQGIMSTALEHDEVLVSIHFSVWPAGHGWAFEEFARRHGDFAMAGAAALLELDAARRIQRAVVVVCGLGNGPVRVSAVEQALIGFDTAALASAKPGTTGFEVLAAPASQLEAFDDPHAPKEYRQRLAATMVARALRRAALRARGEFQELAA